MELIHSLLLKAIEGESGAEAQYKAFASKALEEGYPGVSVLFMALSRAESIHIANHHRSLERNGFSLPLPEFDVSCNIESTQKNLEKAVKAEYEEFKEMYPSFRRQIQKKYGKQFNAKIALLSIKWASESEAGHHLLLKAALNEVAAGRDVSGGQYYLCSVCGNIEFYREGPEKPCSICGHDISFFKMMQVEK